MRRKKKKFNFSRLYEKKKFLFFDKKALLPWGELAKIAIFYGVKFSLSSEAFESFLMSIL